MTDSLPWRAMLRAALSAGLTAEDFWKMSPAAVLRLVSKEAGRAPRREGNLAECP